MAIVDLERAVDGLQTNKDRDRQGEGLLSSLLYDNQKGKHSRSFYSSPKTREISSRFSGSRTRTKTCLLVTGQPQFPTSSPLRSNFLGCAVSDRAPESLAISFVLLLWFGNMS